MDHTIYNYCLSQDILMLNIFREGIRPEILSVALWPKQLSPQVKKTNPKVCFFKKVLIALYIFPSSANFSLIFLLLYFFNHAGGKWRER